MVPQVTACVDGVPSDGVARALTESKIAWTFLDRPDDKPDPNKNGARNMAVSLSTADFVMCLDQDLFPSPGFVASLYAAINDPSVINPYHAVFFPFDWRMSEHPKPPSELWGFEEMKAVAKPWQPYYAPLLPRTVGRGAKTLAVGEMKEGQQLLSRHLFHAIGGYDVRYRGWGGNKEDLSRRLSLAEIPAYLIGEAHLFHQPHAHARSNTQATSKIDLFRQLNYPRASPAPPYEWIQRKQLVASLNVATQAKAEAQ